MRISLSFEWGKWIEFQISIPRLGLILPGDVPASFEAAETWGEDG